MGTLQSLSTPPAPNPDGQSSSTGGGLSGMGGGMPMMASPPTAPAPNGGPPQQQPQQPPAPNHAQTVAALRHFHAIGKQLEIALKDPDVGKADLKKKVIEGMTTLVAQRILSPAQAVTQLSTFPERPFEQKKWLADHLMQTQQAEIAVLTHHGMAFAGQGPQPAPSPDSHMEDIQGMMSAHYARQ